MNKDENKETSKNKSFYSIFSNLFNKKNENRDTIEKDPIDTINPEDNNTEDLNQIPSIKDEFSKNTENFKISGNSTDLDKLSNFVDNLEKSKHQPQDEKEVEIPQDNSSFMKKIADKIIELDEFEDENEDEKIQESFFQKFLKSSLILKEKLQSNLSNLKDKLPPGFKEQLKNDNVIQGILAFILVSVFYFFNYSPYTDFQQQENLLSQEQYKNQTLKEKLVQVEKLLKDKQKSNIESESKFNQLKNSVIFNQFEDSLSVSEYLQNLIKQFNIKINAIGETVILQDTTNNNSNQGQKTEKTADLPSTDNQTIQGIRIKYNLSGNFNDIEQFLVALEDGKVFIDSLIAPITFSLLPNDELVLDCNILAFLDMEKLKEKNQNRPEFPKDDVTLKKMIFSKNGSENIRKIFQSAKIFKLNTGYYTILKLTNEKTLILKNEDDFEENGSKYTVEINKDSVQIINLENDEMLELKNEAQVMKND